MIRPKPLKKGDKVGVIATSGLAKSERIEPALKALNDLGLNVVVGSSVYSKHGYLSGEDRVRADDINYMFKDTSIKGIFVMRGGYGAQRILDMIDYEAVKNNPKVFAGYSDVTILHNIFNQKCNLITFHTPMPASELYKEVDEYTKSYYLKNIFSNEPLGKLKNPKEENMKTLVGGKANGILTGGNLSLVVTSLGTPYEIDTKGKILFLEDVGEETYKIDRMFMQLKQCNKFKDASGVILGAFTDCNSEKSKDKLTLEEVIEEIIVPENKPIIANVICGHCMPTMSLPLGSKTFIDADKKEILLLEWLVLIKIIKKLWMLHEKS